MAMNDNREVTYEIVEEIGIISSHQTGWNKEINMVSWNGNSPKYDIRDWSPDHAQMGRGITLHEKEMRMILDLLRRRPRSSRVGRAEVDSIDKRADDDDFNREEIRVADREIDAASESEMHTEEEAKDLNSLFGGVGFDHEEETTAAI